jgi:hypothetical protein
MNSSTAPRCLCVSDRRPTPTYFSKVILPSPLISVAPFRRPSSAFVVEEAKDETYYLDILTEVTDADEMLAEHWEATAIGKSMKSTTALKPYRENEQLGCASFWGATEYVELLFDAETPLASDEDLALRGMFTPESLPEQVARLVNCYQESFLRPDLRDNSNAKRQPSLAVLQILDPLSNTLDFDTLPVFQGGRYTIQEHGPTHRGRSLTRTSSVVSAEVPATGEHWQLENDSVLQHATGQSLLPGLHHLCNITTCSVSVLYDRDIDDLYHATACFLGDCEDGECTCLSGKTRNFPVPGEDFVLANEYDDLSLSYGRSTEKDIFELIDEIVEVDMFDGSSTSHNDLEEPQPHPDPLFTTSQEMKGFVAYGRLLYPPILDNVSNVRDSDNVSDVSETDEAESLAPTQYPEITYVDADTQKCIAYTAFNQLFMLEEDEMRPVIHRDIPDEEDEAEAELSEHSFLYQERQAHEDPSPPSDNACPNKFWSDITSQPPALPHIRSKTQSGVRQQCAPYGLYSSNMSHHQRHLPRLTLATQLLPRPRPLSTVEKEQLSYPSPSFSGDSIDFADHRGFVKPLVDRRLGFLDLDDEDEENDVEPSLESPVRPSSPMHFAYEDIFTDAVWDSAPDLTLAQPSCSPCAATKSTSKFPSTLLFEAYEIEIHNHLMSMFGCLNNGRSSELAAVSNDLHWTLCALAHDYPAVALLRSLGAAVEILAERVAASILPS